MLTVIIFCPLAQSHRL